MGYIKIGDGLYSNGRYTVQIEDGGLIRVSEEKKSWMAASKSLTMWGGTTIFSGSMQELDPGLRQVLRENTTGTP